MQNRFNYNEHYRREYGNLKRNLSKIISELRTENKEYSDFLIRVRDRMNTCPHCDGETDDSGSCLSRH
jgi:hypothetical protein